MYTAVIKLNALPNPVRSAAQYHDFRFVRVHGTLILPVICGKIVSAVRRTADMDAFPCFFHPKGNAAAADFLLRHLQQTA